MQMCWSQKNLRGKSHQMHLAQHHQVQWQTLEGLRNLLGILTHTNAIMWTYPTIIMIPREAFHYTHLLNSATVVTVALPMQVATGHAMSVGKLSMKRGLAGNIFTHNICIYLCITALLLVPVDRWVPNMEIRNRVRYGGTWRRNMGSKLPWGAPNAPKGSQTAHILKCGTMDKSKFKTYICPNCNKKYMDTKGLENHMAKMHGEGGGTDECICSQCGQTFQYVQSLTHHQQTQH